jgi:acetyltransferase
MPHPLESLFRPKSIAVVGASSNPEKLGFVLLKNVIDYGYKGDLFPINPGGGEILGYKAFPSVKDVGNPIDLILISIPGPAVPAVIKEAGESKCKNAVILSSGFGEMGGEGESAQQAIEEVCQSTGLRVLGPNCMGVYNNTDNLNGTYFWELPRIEGSVSFISQSGAFGGVMFNEIRAREMGVSKFFSIGNQVDITHTDLLEALVEDKDTGVVGLFIEAIRDGDRFLKALEAFTADRPVVAFKGGKTEAGVRAAASHTGSMAGSYAVYKSALEDAGAIVAEDSEEFFDSLMALSLQKPPGGKRVTIMTISGGPCVVAGDNCERLDIEVPQLSDDLQRGILELTPPFAAPSNPVDMTPQMSPSNFIPCVDLVVKQDDIDGVIAINVGLDYAEFAQAFIEASSNYDKPITTFTIDTPILTKLFKEAGVPIYPTPERAVTAYNALVRFALRPQYHRYTKEIVPKRPSRILMDFLKEYEEDLIPEFHAKKALAEYGVPVVDEQIVKIWSSTLTAAQDLGYPLVLKLHSTMIMHKTEVDAVFLNVQNEDELRKAWEKLNHAFPADDYVLQRMVPTGHELIVGSKRDAAFGPVVAVGLGGVFTEIFEDIALGVCPVVKDQAHAMLTSLKSHKILQGYRNLPAIDEEKLIGIILAVSDFMLANPNVTELDVNPLIAHEDSLTAVDALIKVERE